MPICLRTNRLYPTALVEIRVITPTAVLNSVGFASYPRLCGLLSRARTGHQKRLPAGLYAGNDQCFCADTWGAAHTVSQREMTPYPYIVRPSKIFCSDALGMTRAESVTRGFQSVALMSYSPAKVLRSSSTTAGLLYLRPSFVLFLGLRIRGSLPIVLVLKAVALAASVRKRLPRNPLKFCRA